MLFLHVCPQVVRGPAYGNGDLCRRRAGGLGSGDSFLKLAGTAGDNGRVRGIVLSRRATNFTDFLAFTFIQYASSEKLFKANM